MCWALEYPALDFKILRKGSVGHEKEYPTLEYPTLHFIILRKAELAE